jgi:molybdopterin converting factor small subunit
MIVRLRFFGPLERYFGRPRIEVELPAGAKLRDLWEWIDTHWGEKLPPQFWDAEAKRFRRRVLVMTHNTDVYDDDLPLSDQQEIFLLMALAGG